MPAFEGFDQLDQQEVFETSDIESISSDSKSPIIISRRDSLSFESIDIEKSRDLFEHSKVNTNLTDFSGRVDKLLGSYQTFTINETIEEKLGRIQRELEDVKEEILKEKDTKMEKDLRQVDLLKEAFNDINKEIKEKPLLNINIVQEKIQDKVEINNVGNKVTSEDLLKINEKIHALECLLGYTHPLEPTETVTTKLNSLYSKLQLISKDSDSLKSITNQIDTINKKFENSLALRRKGLIEEETNLYKLEDKELLSMYNILLKLSPFIDLLPSLLKRLESVHQIHVHSAGVVKFVNGLESQLDYMEADMKQWENSLNEMDGKIKEMDMFLQKG